MADIQWDERDPPLIPSFLFFEKIIFVCVMNSWIEAHPVDSLSSDELFLIYHSESTGRERRAAK